jgi:hypothetical protein
MLVLRRPSVVKSARMRDRLPAILLTALLAQIPFELQYTLLGLTNLQWSFVFLATASAPLLYSNWANLRRDRLVQAAALFVAVQWAAAMYAPEFNGNAYKAAARFTSGFLLLLIVRIVPDRPHTLRVMPLAAFAAASYALVAYAGFGLPWLFRSREFFVAQVQRLSGSFEYPNVAAAFFALFLPLIWWGSFRPLFKWFAIAVMSAALILTLSRGAVAAVLAVVAFEAFRTWRTGDEWRATASFILAVIVACAIILPFSPYLFHVLTRPNAANPPAAQYNVPWNYIRQQPDTRDRIHLKVRNAGTIPWLAKGRGRVAISYRVLDEVSKTAERGSVITDLQHDIQAGEAADVPVDFVTPRRPGKYLVAFDLFVREFDWFSNAGVAPVFIEADVQTNAIRSVGEVDLSTWYRMREERRGVATPALPRSELWLAAIKMFAAHPFGVGPDNYRLHYGKYLGFTQWDTNIYSNNMYLELLTGSGVIGLAAFALFASRLRCQGTPACLALGVFFLHGLVDVFLMPTPIYFAFWILAGLAATDFAQKSPGRS